MDEFDELDGKLDELAQLDCKFDELASWTVSLISLIS